MALYAFRDKRTAETLRRMADGGAPRHEPRSPLPPTRQIASLLLGKPTAEVDTDEFCDVRLYAGEKGDENAVPGADGLLTDVYCRLASQPLTTDNWVYVGQVNGELEIVAANPCQ